MSGDSSSVAASRLRIAQRLIMKTVAVAARAKRRLLAAMHESRRRQAAIEYVRYQHLIYDPTTGICFGGNTTTESAATRSEYPHDASRAGQRSG